MVVRVVLEGISHLLHCSLGYINFIILPLMLSLIINFETITK
jgi:hypothetical protein